MKDLLFEVLERIGPNEILEISTARDYCIEICREDSVFPLAYNLSYVSLFHELYANALNDEYGSISVRPVLNFDPFEERANDSAERLNRNSYEEQYRESHTIEFNGSKYLIVGEILYIKYKDTYMEVQHNSVDGKVTHFISYNEIKNIRYKEGGPITVLQDYNVMQYKVNNK